MTELSAPFDMTLPALSKHLGILEASGLVESTKRGRVRTFRAVPRRLGLAQDWLNEQRGLWEKRLDQLDEHLQKIKEKNHET